MKILTFDIEEWFHILDNDSTKTVLEWEGYESRIHENMDKIFHLLDKHNQKATFFCLGWIAEKYPDVVSRIDKLGYEIGTHSYYHQLAYEQSPKDFRDDLVRSIDVLQEITGKKVRSYRAPGFSIKKENSWALDILVQCGIEIDCSIFPSNRAHGGFSSFEGSSPILIATPSGMLKEFPINAHSILGKEFIFTGGGYFRLLPYWLIKRFTRTAPYIMTYFHPRDFDGDQPIIDELSSLRKFKSYYGLYKTLNKLDVWLADNEFIDLSTADNIFDWEGVEILDIKGKNNQKN